MSRCLKQSYYCVSALRRRWLTGGHPSPKGVAALSSTSLWRPWSIALLPPALHIWATQEPTTEECAITSWRAAKTVSAKGRTSMRHRASFDTSLDPATVLVAPIFRLKHANGYAGLKLSIQPWKLPGVTRASTTLSRDWQFLSPVWLSNLISRLALGTL